MKTEQENYNNWNNYWRTNTMYPTYLRHLNYPGRQKQLLGYKPDQREEEYVLVNKYTINRHAFSCANLLKSRGLDAVLMNDQKDPSLTLYGIYTTLLLDRQDDFEGTVFVSQLVRTWQTAILLYGSLGPLTLTIAPYIIETGMTESNKPLEEDGQRHRMEQFMILLKKIYS
jgi:hypothetical protein